MDPSVTTFQQPIFTMGSAHWCAAGGPPIPRYPLIPPIPGTSKPACFATSSTNWLHLLDPRLNLPREASSVHCLFHSYALASSAILRAFSCCTGLETCGILADVSDTCFNARAYCAAFSSSPF